MAEGGVGLVFAQRRGAVRDDAAGFEAAVQVPVELQGPAGSDAGLEFFGERWEADLLDGGDVASIFVLGPCGACREEVGR